MMHRFPDIAAYTFASSPSPLRQGAAEVHAVKYRIAVDIIMVFT